MIRITGRDAVAEAIFNMDYCLYTDIRFFVKRNGIAYPLPPALIPILIEGGEITSDAVSCEIPSIWDLMEIKKEHLGLSFFTEGRLVLIFTPLHFNLHKPQPFLSQPFAVEKSTFDHAEEWARSMPAIDEMDIVDKFLGRLNPRINLKRGAWKSNMHLSMQVEELSRLLESIFGIKRATLPCSWTAGSGLSQHSGHLFDRLLDAIAAKYLENGLPPPDFCLSPQDIRSQKNSLPEAANAQPLKESNR